MNKEEYLAQMRELCLQAVQVSNLSPEEQRWRAARLGVRRDWEQERLGAMLPTRLEQREYWKDAAPLFAAAMSLLEPPAELPRQAKGPVFRWQGNGSPDDFSELEQSLFDGRRTLGEVAGILWAMKPYGQEETETLPAVRKNLEERVRRVEARGCLAEVVRRVWTREMLAEALREAGIRRGGRLMVHAGLRSLGIVEGGAETVIAALQDVVGTEGILAMPALSAVYDAPDGGEFSPDAPIVPWIGVLPQVFRKMQGVVRSGNPTHSVLAWGKDAGDFVAQADPWDCFAPDGPWAKLRDQDGQILLLGESSIESNTFLHACEAWYATYMDRLVVRVKGIGKVVETHFPGGCRGGWYHLGREADYFRKLEKAQLVRNVQIGEASAVLLEAGPLAEAMRRFLAEDPALLLHHGNCADCAKMRGRIRK